MVALALSLVLAAVLPQDRASLETLLERARAQRQAVHERLSIGIGAVLKRHDDLEQPLQPDLRDQLAGDLAALGEEAAVLLVPLLDPSPGEDARALSRADLAARALGRLETSVATGALLELVERGSSHGKLNALRALETTKQPGRVRPALMSFFARAEGELKQAALRALIRLGGEGNDPFLAEILASREEALVGLALAALADLRAAGAAAAVRALLADGPRAVPHAKALLAYYTAVREAVGPADVQSLLALATQAGLPKDVRLAIVAALPLFDPPLSSDLRKALEPLLHRRDAELREATLVALCRLGDKSARRELLEEYDEFVRVNDRFSDAWARRGQILLAIGDNDGAIRDFQKALSLGRKDAQLQTDTYVGLARAYARKGRDREAAEWLRKAPMSMSELRKLAADPDFRELRDSRYGREVFGP